MKYKQLKSKIMKTNKETGKEKGKSKKVKPFLKVTPKEITLPADGSAVQIKTKSNTDWSIE
jgi:hypothetical protein